MVSSSGSHSHSWVSHISQITLSVRLAVGMYLYPALTRSSGQGEACGHEVNEARRTIYVDIDILDVKAGERSTRG